jgi:hypothetical protein
MPKANARGGSGSEKRIVLAPTNPIRAVQKIGTTKRKNFVDLLWKEDGESMMIEAFGSEVVLLFV